VLAHIEGFFAARGRPRPAKTEVETLVPEGALVFLNPTGTAPGLALRTDASRPGQWLVMLPGPPRELRPMFDSAVAPLIRREFAQEIFVCRTLRSTGVGEARVQELIEAEVAALVQQGLGIGYCARPGAVDVRLTAGGERAEQLVSDGAAVVKSILGGQLYGADDEELESVVVRLLTEQKKSLALAESCTGGNIAHRVTNVPGASAVFWGGAVSYANAAKETLLGVRAETLREHGAVSEAVARELAAGIRERSGADFALAVTGIAGPDGGTPEKPVGTVFLALAAADGMEVERRLNPWDRTTFKEVTATQALEKLRRRLAGLPP
jgi:nicotinamide-nucleotide amidase